MRVILLALIGATMLLAACQGAQPNTASTSSGAPAVSHELKVGDPAPDFTLPDQNRQDVTLSSFRGKTVQLAFYVWAFSGG